MSASFVMAIGLAFIGLCRALPPSTRPDSLLEDKRFWRDYGQAQLKSVLARRLNENHAKNVILFIGDGLGVSTHTAARIYKGQRNGFNGEEDSLVWESFPYTAQSKTYNTDHMVPDSAGTATALFSGVKTRLAVLGIDNIPPYNSCDHNLVERSKLKGLLHKAVEDGKATGIITNTRITHATPGASYAHTQNRDWECDADIPENFRGKGCADIAKQLVFSDVGQRVNVFFGGGKSKFLPVEDGGSRLDGENLVETWKKLKADKRQDYEFLETKEDLDAWQHSDYVLGLFSPSHMSAEALKDKESPVQPSLSDMTKEAILRLKKHKNGFFMMVENGLIDQNHHRNFAKLALEETLELDKAVRVALDNTDEEDTLIIVTGDHSHPFNINGYPRRGSSIFGSIYEPVTGDVALYPDGSVSAYSILSYANGDGFWSHFTNNSARPWADLREMETEELEHRMPAPYALKNGYETHSGEDVPLLANGPWAHLFVGVQEQSYFAHAIEYAAGWSELGSPAKNRPVTGKKPVASGAENSRKVCHIFVAFATAFFPALLKYFCQ